MRRSLSRSIVVAVVMASMLGAHGLPGAPARSILPVAMAQAPSAVGPCNVVQKGPEGQSPTKASTVGVKAADFTQLKAKHKTFRVATFWQVIAPGNTDLMLAGLQHAFNGFAQRYGVHIKISAQADSGFDAAKQTDQINTLVNTKPDAMVGILDDQVAVSQAVKNIMQHHIPLIMWDVDAKGVYPTSIVTANGRLAGCQLANLMAKAIGGSGDIASMPMKIKYYPTDQRVDGFNSRIQYAYPNIHIVAHDGATVLADGQTAGEGILQRFPNLKGIFASWQDPAMGVVAATKTLSRSNVAVLTTDMAPSVDLEIAKCGLVKATAPQLAYNMGETEAKLVVKGILKERVPKYVVTDDPIVTHKNLLQIYPKVFHTAAPSNLVKAYVHQNCG
jgi:ribose transport system substrate-binding protein